MQNTAILVIGVGKVSGSTAEKQTTQRVPALLLGHKCNLTEQAIELEAQNYVVCFEGNKLSVCDPCPVNR